VCREVFKQEHPGDKAAQNRIAKQKCLQVLPYLRKLFLYAADKNVQACGGHAIPSIAIPIDILQSVYFCARRRRASATSTVSMFGFLAISKRVRGEE
jgi:hypothetical protein